MLEEQGGQDVSGRGVAIGAAMNERDEKGGRRWPGWEQGTDESD